MSLLCRFSAAGMTVSPRADAAGGRKAPRHEVAGSWAVAGSERYGDLMSAPSSMVGGTLARRRLRVCTHGRSAEFGGHSERLNGRSAR